MLLRSTIEERRARINKSIQILNYHRIWQLLLGDSKLQKRHVRTHENPIFFYDKINTGSFLREGACRTYTRNRIRLQ
jgi:hypothetical protein